MKVLNLGSLNIDKTYTVEDFVQEGQTINAIAYSSCCGGKGLNQSVAMARAGMEVYHAGMIGQDGDMLKRKLEESGVHTKYLAVAQEESGHALIQLDQQGRNCIICYGGANHAVTTQYIDAVLQHFVEGDYLLVQNEITNVPYAMVHAKNKGMQVVFNPSPITPKLKAYPLEMVDCFLVNETEGEALTGEHDYEAILAGLHMRYPKALLVLTVGDRGVLCQQGETTYRHGVYNVPVVDTTAAGDTFCGYFIACLAQGQPVAQVLKTASAASALSVSHPGASDSIPQRAEVEAFLQSKVP